jgi:hypothetical protein
MSCGCTGRGGISAIFHEEELYSMKDLFAQAWVVRLMIITTGCVAIVAGMRAVAEILNPIFIAILVAVILDLPRSWLIKRGMSKGSGAGGYNCWEPWSSACC